MATYADNNWYFSIDGTDVSAYLKRISLEPVIATNETTAGSGVDDRTRAVGLRDHTLSFDIVHDNAAGYALTLLAVGSHDIIYGPEGTATGKPKHAQAIIFTGAPHETTVEKNVIMYSVSGEAAAAPTTNMFAGGTW
jgi:hypothetical protein